MDLYTLTRRTGKAAVYYLKNPRALLEREQVVRTADGCNMLSLSENLIERTIAKTGLWEPAETAAIRSVVRPGSVCVDVGANIGYFSLLMASLGGRVSAYEPTTYGHTRLTRNIGLNPTLADRITVHKMGLGDRSLVIEEALEARFSLRFAAHSEPETMTIEPLDKIWQGPLDVIKIDVDGHDTEVVRGAAETLKRCRPVVMAEFCNRVLKPYGSSAPDLAKAFMDCGYSRRRVLETGEDTTLEAFVSGRWDDDPSSWNVLLQP